MKPLSSEQITVMANEAVQQSQIIAPHKPLLSRYPIAMAASILMLLSVALFYPEVDKARLLDEALQLEDMLFYETVTLLSS